MIVRATGDRNMKTSRIIAMLRWLLYAAFAATISSAYADTPSVTLDCGWGSGYALVLDFTNNNVIYGGATYRMVATAQTVKWTDNLDNEFTIDRVTGVATRYAAPHEMSDGSFSRGAYFPAGTCKVAEQKF